MKDQILQFFEYQHLPQHLAAVSAPFCGLAHQVVETLPRNAERTVALRKLLEAKDAAVRARLFKDVMPTDGGSTHDHLPGCRWAWDGSACLCLDARRVNENQLAQDGRIQALEEKHEALAAEVRDIDYRTVGLCRAGG
jgi:hypothetical protein